MYTKLDIYSHANKAILNLFERERERERERETFKHIFNHQKQLSVIVGCCWCFLHYSLRNVLGLISFRDKKKS